MDVKRKIEQSAYMHDPDHYWAHETIGGTVAGVLAIAGHAVWQVLICVITGVITSLVSRALARIVARWHK